MKKLLLFIGLVLLSLFSVNALTYSNVTLNTSISNSSLTFDTINVTVDSTIINDNYLYLTNITYINGELTVNKIPFYNHSEINTKYDSSEFPHIQSKSSSTIRLNSSIDLLNLNLTFTNIASEPLSITYTSSNNTYTQIFTSSSFTYSSNTLTLVLNGIEQGSNTFTFKYVSDSQGFGGGGGGISLDVKECDIEINPKVLVLDSNLKNTKLEVISNEDSLITDLDYEFKYFSGSKELVNKLDIKGESTSLSPNYVDLVSVGFFSKLDLQENAKAKLIISSKQCQNLEVSISILMENKTVLQIFEDKIQDLENKSITNIVLDLTNETIIQDKFFIEESDNRFIEFVKKFDSVFGYTLIFITILFVLLYPTKDSKVLYDNMKANILIRLITWIVLSLITLGIVLITKIIITGG